MASTVTNFTSVSRDIDLPDFSLIQGKWLGSRLLDELRRASHELIKDPRGFIECLVSPDYEDPQRQKRIYAALAFALAIYLVLGGAAVAIGWRTLAASTDNVDERTTVSWVGSNDPISGIKDVKPGTPRGDGGAGGGGGQNDPRPVPQGVRPQMLPQPQIVAANPSNIANPSLPLPTTLVGPTAEPPPPDAALGDPKGKEGEFSGGPGSKGGVGTGDGSGFGPGSGGGTERGSGGGVGGKDKAAGSPEGTGGSPNVYYYQQLPKARSSNISWIYRARPVVTREAQENKSIGVVVLRATFHADGRITDIEVVQGVDFMTESAIEALAKSKFRPATVDGVPVTLRRVVIRIDVHHN